LAFRFTPVQAPLEISGVTIPGVPALQTPAGQFRLPCGLGPVIELNGQTLATQVTGTFAELLAGQPMSFTACPSASITAGANRVFEPARDRFDVQDVVLAVHGRAPASGKARRGAAGTVPVSGEAASRAVSRGAAGRAVSGEAAGTGTAAGGALGPAPGPAVAATVRSWAPARRVLSVAPSARSYLVVNENFNAGWQARAGGRLLRAVRLDGWKQAWLLPAGTAGTVILTYPPDTLYRRAIFGGLGSLGLVMLVALWPGQPAWRPRRRARPRWLPRRRRVLERRAAERDTGATDAGHESAVPAAAAIETAGTAAGPEAATTAAGPKAAGPGTGPEATGNAGAPRPPARWRLRQRARSGATLTEAAAVCCLALAGLWLGGYPGAVILPAATALFTVAVSYRRASPWWYQLSRPRVPAILLLAAAACAVAGGQLVPEGTTGPVATALVSTAPQVLCLAVAGRLAAALVVGDP